MYVNFRRTPGVFGLFYWVKSKGYKRGCCLLQGIQGGGGALTLFEYPDRIVQLSFPCLIFSLSPQRTTISFTLSSEGKLTPKITWTSFHRARQRRKVQRFPGLPCRARPGSGSCYDTRPRRTGRKRITHSGGWMIPISWPETIYRVRRWHWHMLRSWRTTGNNASRKRRWPRKVEIRRWAHTHHRGGSGSRLITNECAIHANAWDIAARCGGTRVNGHHTSLEGHTLWRHTPGVVGRVRKRWSAISGHRDCRGRRLSAIPIRIGGRWRRGEGKPLVILLPGSSVGHVLRACLSWSVLSLLLPPSLSHLLELCRFISQLVLDEPMCRLTSRQPLLAMFLRHHMRVQMVQRPIRLFTTIPTTRVQPFNLFIPSPRPLFLPMTGWQTHKLHLVIGRVGIIWGATRIGAGSRDWGRRCVWCADLTGERGWERRSQGVKRKCPVSRKVRGGEMAVISKRQMGRSWRVMEKRCSISHAWDLTSDRLSARKSHRTVVIGVAGQTITRLRPTSESWWSILSIEIMVRCLLLLKITHWHVRRRRRETERWIRGVMGWRWWELAPIWTRNVILRRRWPSVGRKECRIDSVFVLWWHILRTLLIPIFFRWSTKTQHLISFLYCPLRSSHISPFAQLLCILWHWATHAILAAHHKVWIWAATL